VRRDRSEAAYAFALRKPGSTEFDDFDRDRLRQPILQLFSFMQEQGCTPLNRCGFANGFLKLGVR
jgi:hypothetical protein